MLTPENAAEHVRNVINELPFYPGGFERRGIVIPGGGIRYFTCAWVCINMLRRLGCTLPIELWHLGPKELTDEMRKLVEPFDVTAVDAHEVRKTKPARMLYGWPLKCYAIMNSRFADVMLLDADNVPVVDPTFLFDTQQYKSFGAIFWPDFMSQTPEQLIWRLMDLPYFYEPQVESGQLVIDKRRSWRPLSLAMWMNEHADFWYDYILGDKETFHFGWRKLDIPYAMPSRPIDALSFTMCQHDFDGRRIFQHRNMAKWTLGENQPVDGFLFENECLELLSELRERWHPLTDLIANLSENDRTLMNSLSSGSFNYIRVGFDERQLRLRNDGLVIGGTGGCEIVWWIENGELILASDPDHITCRLAHRDGIWEGKWLVHEQMQVQLRPE